MLRDGIAGTVGSYLIVTILFLLSLIIISSLSLTELVNVTVKWAMYISQILYAGSKFIALKSREVFFGLKETYAKHKAPEIEEPLISEANGALNGKQSPVDDILNEEVINLEDEIITEDAPANIIADADQPQIVVETPKLDGLEEFFPKKEVLHDDYVLPSTDLLDPKLETNIQVEIKMQCLKKPS